MSQFKIVTCEKELLQALVVRALVFIEEQKLPFAMEYDDYDNLKNSEVLHIIAKENDEPYAAGRIIFKTDDRAKLERIAVHPYKLGKGVGKQLVRYMLEVAIEKGGQEIYIHAQSYLREFYQELGFRLVGDYFFEAGIEHIQMDYIGN